MLADQLWIELVGGVLTVRLRGPLHDALLASCRDGISVHAGAMGVPVILIDAQEATLDAQGPPGRIGGPFIATRERARVALVLGQTALRRRLRIAFADPGVEL